MQTKNLNITNEENSELFISRRKAARAAQRKHLLQDLDKAVKLGNFYNEPVVIEFYDRQGKFHKREVLLSTVTENYAITRGDKFIHLDHIKRVIV